MPETKLFYEDEKTGRQFEIEVEYHFYKENYGADADGNRGVMTTFYEIDDETIYEIIKGERRERKFESLPKEIRDEIDSLEEDFDPYDDEDAGDYEEDPDRKGDEERDGER